ncbi:AraC family transcriptional regulator [Gorillibacterium massiliense]|uniref:AraC family transcriptional regulator n=1 Tax=Gorillibacterium massiliense TaxID=1280390 RepID=UPI0004B37494|nr:AraC family transcriptional regulator [Gorillibacterium massiliense]
MYEWNEMVQLMIDWVDDNLTSTPSLLNMSMQLGYSPYYCTKQFHALTGMTLRDYVWTRRISRAALELRDTDARVLDIAVKYGFSSQEAFTRAFVKAFQVTPHAYRKAPRPIPLAIRAEVFSPYHYLIKERGNMRNIHLQQAEIKIERIPAHKFIGIWDGSVQYYGEFWDNGHDCDDICGTLTSMSNLTLPGQISQTAGWFYDNGKKGYLYGIPVAADYTGEIPAGMKCRDIPESDYLVFFHPPFDYLKDNGAVMEVVEQTAWTFDPESIGYVWNEDPPFQDYQRHYPEGYGYAVLRPVKKPLILADTGK